MIRSYYLAADSQQYAAWNRTRRLHATPYLARTETNASRQATAMAAGGTTNFPAPGDAVINMAEARKEKKQDTLFGPNIGIVSDGPAWAQSEEVRKGNPSDTLTPDIVKRWVEISKESIQPTTTLQALVNLKRPTLRLSPLEIHPSDDPAHAESHHHHALEFEYDCDAPKCGITVQAIVTPGEQRTSEKADPSASRIMIYESVGEGGFGRLLKLEDGATIELGRFEHTENGGPSIEVVDQSSPKVDKGLATPELPELHSQPITVVSAPPHEQQENARKRRFTALHFRRRDQNRSVSGPALAVVDNDASAAPESDKEKEKDAQGDEGVRVVIRLVALDESGKALQSVNQQSTYLHVVRFGPAVAEGEDNRPWVVKVVKREATIGPHTFHLHEIYGLSSASAQPAAPTPTAPAVHTYPPTVPAPTEEEPSSECLVCLSSPREVVLLPCRHLVACKECAINMVEFGAGGAIQHADESAPAPGAAAAAEPQSAEAPSAPEEAPAPPDVAASPALGAADEATPAAPEGEADIADSPTAESPEAPAPPTAEEDETPAATPAQHAPPTPSLLPIAPVPVNQRRKRRAKGWHCPVCRQPYTSLLRITTTPPTAEDGKGGKRVSTSTIDHPLASPTSAGAEPVLTPESVAEAQAEEAQAQAGEPAPPPRSLRPAFLRGFSRHAVEPAWV
ncbi:hypothetical protein BC834DRAFT_462584 [Gloeopeniophorella convolvens]|nr:hypothetical protein BC834DRAFT_462584 [Gloeopeniophorella convolvens]